MHSFGRHCAAAVRGLSRRWMCARRRRMAPHAQPRTPAGELRYETLREQEQRVAQSPAVDGRRFPRRHQSLLELRSAVSLERFRRQRALAGRPPVGGSCRRFGEERDKYRAIQLFQWLRDQYPHSPLSGQGRCANRGDPGDGNDGAGGGSSGDSGRGGHGDSCGASRRACGSRPRDARTRSRGAVLSGTPGGTRAGCFSI